MAVTLRVMLCCVFCCGCASFKTTIMQRSCDNRFYENYPCSHTKGLPVKLKVPTHVEATVTEVFFIQGLKFANEADRKSKLAAAEKQLCDALELKKVATTKEQKDSADNAIAAAEQAIRDASQHAMCQEIPVMLNNKEIRHMEVKTRVIYTDKVFTVDFRRPAGGTLDVSAIQMDSEQYFQKISATYTEETLNQINTAIGSIKSGITAKSASLTGKGLAGLAMDERTVAVRRFDISEPDWEAQLNYFVDQHVTGCACGCEDLNNSAVSAVFHKNPMVQGPLASAE